MIFSQLCILEKNCFNRNARTINSDKTGFGPRYLSQNSNDLTNIDLAYVLNLRNKDANFRVVLKCNTACLNWITVGLVFIFFFVSSFRNF